MLSALSFQVKMFLDTLYYLTCVSYHLQLNIIIKQSALFFKTAKIEETTKWDAQMSKNT